MDLNALKTTLQRQGVKWLHPSSAMPKPQSSSQTQLLIIEDMCTVFAQISYLLFFTPPTLLYATLNIWGWETSNYWYISKVSC